MNNSEIANAFMMQIVDIVDDDMLRIIRDKLTVFLNDYDIQEKCTDLVEYTYEMPKELIKYLAVLKIESASAKTIKVYKQVLELFFESVRKPVTEITSDDILVYLYQYQEQRGISQHTLDIYRTYINSFFEFCVNEDYIVKNPCKKIKKIKYRIDKEEALTDYQIEEIRSLCETKRDVAMLDFFLSTGCRVSELCSINVSDIDFRKREVMIVGKGNKERKIYITGKAMHSLKEYLTTRPDRDSDILFSSQRKPYGRLKKDAVELIFRNIGRKCDIKLHPHLFRRTFATNSLRRGMPITTIQILLGHSNIETTMRYISMVDTDVKQEHGKYVA